MPTTVKAESRKPSVRWRKWSKREKKMTANLHSHNLGPSGNGKKWDIKMRIHWENELSYWRSLEPEMFDQ